MNTTISNNGLPPFTPPPSGSGNSASAASGAVGNAGSPSAKADDQVQLTDSALALQRAASAAEGAPINQQKVDQIRAALADGSYQVNAGSIADHMLDLEQQMSGVKV